MLGDKLLCPRPQRLDALRGVIDVDDEPIGLVEVLHVVEDVVVDVAVKVDFGLDAPVPFVLEERGVLVEEARVPAAHLVVGEFLDVLDFLLRQEVGGGGEEVLVDPGGNVPVLFGDNFWGMLVW